MGFIEGFNKGSKEFVPSLLHTITGIGQGLWHFANEPINISQEFILSVGLYISLAKDEITPEILNDAIPEIKQILNKWIKFSDFEKGRQIGVLIGKYGVDVLFTATSVKAMRQFRELKYANGSLTLDGLEKFKKRKAILDEAEKRTKFRKTLFKDGKIKIHWDKQNKHILGSHNFEENKSYITITKDHLESLLKTFAGTGQPVVKNIGEVGYRERINFKEIIGINVKRNMEKTGELIKEETTNGIIHYDKNGYFHVIPSNPGLF